MGEEGKLDLNSNSNFNEEEVFSGKPYVIKQLIVRKIQDLTNLGLSLKMFLSVGYLKFPTGAFVLTCDWSFCNKLIKLHNENVYLREKKLNKKNRGKCIVGKENINAYHFFLA